MPKIRGPYRSRRLSSVLHEAERLADQGVQELILIAQDTTAYGEDLQDGTNLEKLLKALAKVRRTPLDPDPLCLPETSYFTEGLLETIGPGGKDLPLSRHPDPAYRRWDPQADG